MDINSGVTLPTWTLLLVSMYITDIIAGVTVFIWALLLVLLYYYDHKKSRWGRDFLHLSRPALGPTQSPVQWVAGLSRGKERPGRNADPSPLLVPWSLKGRAIPLLPIWTVRPVQSLSACTRVHFIFFTSRWPVEVETCSRKTTEKQMIICGYKCVCLVKYSTVNLLHGK